MADEADELARLLKVLAVGTRVRIVQILKGRSLCVGALASRLDVLRHEFADWKSAATTSAPADMVQRWHDSIDSAAAREHAATGRPRGTFSFASFAWGAAVTAALLGSLALTFTEKRWPEVQEAINRRFLRAWATAGIVLFANNPRGGS